MRFLHLVCGETLAKLAVGGHDGSFLIVDPVGRVDFVFGVRSHTGEVQSVYLMDADVEKLIEFLTRKDD